MTPEQQARQQIDAQLTASGWIVQDYKALDLSAGPGIAAREVPLATGPCDYLLLVNRKPVGIVEAKRKEQGKNLSIAAGRDHPHLSLGPGGTGTAGLPERFSLRQKVEWESLRHQANPPRICGGNRRNSCDNGLYVLLLKHEN